MSVKSAPYYWVECDNCGARLEYDDFAGMVNLSEAVDHATNCGWSAEGDQHHCPRCPPFGHDAEAGAS